MNNKKFCVNCGTEILLRAKHAKYCKECSDYIIKISHKKIMKKQYIKRIMRTEQRRQNKWVGME